MQVRVIYHACKAQRLDRLKPDIRIGPRHPRLAGIGFRFARWLAAKTMGGCGLSPARLGIRRCADRACARQACARRDGLSRRPRRTRHAQFRRLALVEVTQADGPRLIVNNEEERFSGNKHTTEYPQLSIDAMVATLRGDGPRYRRYRRLAHELGLSDARRHAGALGDRGSCRRVSSSCAPPRPPASTAAASTR